MKKSIKLIEKGFESASYTTPEFKEFCRVFSREFKKMVSEVGCTNVKLRAGHFDISGFFTAPNGQVWYMCLSDVRWGDGMIYFRTAKDYNDYCGGTNNNTKLEYVRDNLKRILQIN